MRFWQANVPKIGKSRVHELALTSLHRLHTCMVAENTAYYIEIHHPFPATIPNSSTKISFK